MLLVADFLSRRWWAPEHAKHLMTYCILCHIYSSLSTWCVPNWNFAYYCHWPHRLQREPVLKSCSPYSMNCIIWCVRGSGPVSPASALFVFFLLPSFRNGFQLFPLTKCLRVTTHLGRTEWRRYADQIPAWPPDIVTSFLCKFPQNLETTAVFKDATIALYTSFPIVLISSSY